MNNFSVIKKLKLVTLKWWMLNLFHRDNLDQVIFQTALLLTIIQEEGETYIWNQHLYMVHFINHNWIYHTLEYTSVGYHRQFLINNLSQKVSYASMMLDPVINEVVMFQPRSGTDLNLESVSNVTSYLNPAPTFNCLLDLFSSPSM